MPEPLTSKKIDNSNQNNTLPKPTSNESVWEGRKIYLIAIGTTVLSLLALSVATVYELSKYCAELAHDKIWIPDIPALEAKIKAKFEESFIDRLKQLPGVDYIRLFKHLAICNKDEEILLKQLQQNFAINDYQLKQILSGAHVRLQDEGKTYQTWVQEMETKQARVSSHPSSGPQYAVRGPFVKELLFSQIEEDGVSYTWFQLENHPVKFGHYIRHMWDYIVYKITQKNQGPYGSSSDIDSRPMVLFPK